MPAPEGAAPDDGLITSDVGPDIEAVPLMLPEQPVLLGVMLNIIVPPDTVPDNCDG